MDDLDLESYWASLRARREVTPLDQPSPVRRSLDRAQAITQKVLSEKFKTLGAGTSDTLAEIVSTGAQVFLDNWYENLRQEGPSALIELILDGKDLSVVELKGFVRALPVQLLERIIKDRGLESKGGGIHVLLAVEYLHRTRRLNQDYELRRDLDGKLLLVTYPSGLDGQELTVRLDEIFEVTEKGSV